LTTQKNEEYGWSLSFFRKPCENYLLNKQQIEVVDCLLHNLDNVKENCILYVIIKKYIIHKNSFTLKSIV
jgi:hypothetical protein